MASEPVCSVCGVSLGEHPDTDACAIASEAPQETLLRMFDEAARWPTVRDVIRVVLMPEAAALPAQPLSPRPDDGLREGLTAIANARRSKSDCPDPMNCMIPQAHADDESWSEFANRLRSLAAAALAATPPAAVLGRDGLAEAVRTFIDSMTVPPGRKWDGSWLASRQAVFQLEAALAIARAALPAGSGAGELDAKPVVVVHVPCGHGRFDCPACGRIVVWRSAATGSGA